MTDIGAAEVSFLPGVPRLTIVFGETIPVRLTRGSSARRRLRRRGR